MFQPPYMFFDYPQGGFRWKDGVDPLLQQLGSLNDASSDLLPSLEINVSQPVPLLTWLRSNSAALITDLHVFVEGVRPCFGERNGTTSPEEWCQPFDKLRHEAKNL